MHPGRYVFDGSNLFLRYFCRRSLGDYFCHIILNSDKLFEKKFSVALSHNKPLSL